MFAALLITVLPTFLAAIVLPKFGFAIKSAYLRVAFSWFAGLYIFTFLTFFLACFYNTFTSHVLLRATYTVLILNEAALFFFIDGSKELIKTIYNKFLRILIFRPANFLLITFCFFFSCVFLAPHLITYNGSIYASPVYWDFHWHAAIIQNFVYGDNFPPQNEAFPGIPMEYHFFGDLVMGMYEVAGMSLTGAITFSSILFLFFSLITIIGISEAFFKSKLLGFLAVCFAIATSSGHFIYYVIQNQGESLSQLISGVFTNSELAFYGSFIYTNPFHYNGAMFNLFYFLEERHMFITPVFLLLCLWIVVNRKNFPIKTLTILGALMGGFFYWNVFVALMIPLGLLFVFLCDEDKKYTLALFLGCFSVIGIQYESLKHAMLSSGVYSSSIAKYPLFNTSFATPVSDHSFIKILGDMLGYYCFAYGLKAILAPIGLVMIWRKQKHLALIFLSFIVPVFIVINTFQISPSGVGENHKFLLNMNILLDLATAYVLYALLSKKIVYKLLAVIFFFCLTASGIIEDVPFINSKPTVLYADYSYSSLSRTIQRNTFPHAVIVGKDIKEIQLAGRKIFVGDSAGDSVSIDKTSREELLNSIYSVHTIHALCSMIGTNPVDYVEFTPSNFLYTQSLNKTLPHFTAYDSNDKLVVFLNTSSVCGYHSPSMVQ